MGYIGLTRKMSFDLRRLMSKRIEVVLSKLLTLMGVVGLTSIVILVITNVLLRTLFKAPILWTLEISGVLVVWFTFILFGVAYREDRHFSIDILPQLLPEKSRKMLRIVVDLITFLGIVFLGYSCIQSIMVNGRMTLTATPLTVTLAFFLPLMIGIVTYLFFIIIKITAILSPPKSKPNREDFT